MSKPGRVHTAHLFRYAARVARVGRNQGWVPPDGKRATIRDRFAGAPLGWTSPSADRLSASALRWALINDNFEFPDLLGAACEYLIQYFADSAGKKGGVNFFGE